MNQRRNPAFHFVLVLLKASAAAFVILAIGQGIWGVLVMLNLASTPTLPWAIAIEGLILFLLWRYTGGWGWPARTAEARRIYRRANRVALSLYLKTFIAGVFSLIALSGWWIVLYRLIPTSPNPLPDYSAYPLTTTIPLLLMAVIAAPVTEEIAFRGYAQGMLERAAPAVIAVMFSSLLFALGHFPQDLAASKFLVYFLVGVTLGTIVYLTNSILPAMIVHALGDATFFLLVWPNDAHRTLITVTGPDASFWINLTQAIVFSVLAILAFLYLRNASRRASSSVGRAGGPMVNEALLSNTES